MDALTVAQPAFRLLYEQKDVTVDLAPIILGVTYTDALAGESDELELTIEDRDGRWKNGWFPGKGDRLTLDMGYAGQELATMGRFEIDEIEFSGPPDTVSIRALAAGVKEALRTATTAGFESETLRQIASGIAERNGLTLVGEGDAIDRTYERVTQHGETDLAFLNRLGLAEGIVFAIKGGQLVWHDQGKLDAAGTILVIKRTDMLRFSFRAKTATTYKACRVSHHHPKTKALITHTETAEDLPSGDTLNLAERCESPEQAQAKAQAALRAANGRQVEGSINLYGKPRLRAGCNIEVQGLGLLDGTYQIQSARHSIDRQQGYTTEIELATQTAQGKTLKTKRIIALETAE